MIRSGKNRATGYTDYFKNRSRTPGGSVDDEEEGGTRRGIPERSTGSGTRRGIPENNSDFRKSITPKDASVAAKRKAALKRRLQLQRDKKVG